jgi:transglutaminase superfamily protein
MPSSYWKSSHRKGFWRATEVPEKLELLRSLLVASASPLLARLPPERLARTLEPRRTSARSQVSAAPATVERALAITSRLIRHTCYTRGITRYFVLSRSGFAVSLVFGIDPISEPPDGHCWIVLNGEPYLELNEPSERFTSVWSIGRAD